MASSLPRPRRTLLVVTVAASLLVAACGGGASTGTATGAAAGSAQTSTTATGSTATGSTGGSSDVPGLAQAQEHVAGWLKGTYTEPVTTDSPPAAQGKKIWVISCGQAFSSCARGTKGAVDAAKAIGWTANVFDTKGNLTTAGDGVRQAIAAKADGIFVYFVDCSYMAKPLQEAKAAGIPVVQAEGIDCNVADPAAAAGFTWSVSYVEGPLLDWLKVFGRAMSAYLVTATKGKGNVLYFADDSAIGTKSVVAGYQEEIKPCTGCTSHVVAFSFDQLGAGVSQQVQQELLKNPAVDAVGVAYDAILQSGVSDGVEQAERGGRKITLTAGEGLDATMDLLRKGVVVAGVGLDNEWEGWSGVDSLNRIMQGKQPVGSGIGIQLYDATHNAPASGPYVAPVDFKAAYTKAWGRS